MQGVESSIETLVQASRDVREKQGEVEEHLRNLASEVDRLADAWTGEAGSAFQQLMERWNEDAGKLREAMSDIADLLEQSADKYQDDQDAHRESINAIDSELN